MDKQLLWQDIDVYLLENYEPDTYGSYAASGHAPKQSSLLHSFNAAGILHDFFAADEEEACEESFEACKIELAAEPSLSEELKDLDASWSETLLHLIDEKGMEDVEVYQRAGIDRRHFSKIRSDRDYRPGKETVLAFCFALGLSLDESEELLKRAGYALSHSSRFDVIVEYFLKQGIHDLFTIDETLIHYDQRTIRRY